MKSWISLLLEGASGVAPRFGRGPVVLGRNPNVCITRLWVLGLDPLV